MRRAPPLTSCVCGGRISQHMCAVLCRGRRVGRLRPRRGGRTALSCKSIEPAPRQSPAPATAVPNSNHGSGAGDWRGAVSTLRLRSLTRSCAADAAKRGPRGFAPSLPQSGFHPASSASAALRLRAAGSLRSLLFPLHPHRSRGPGKQRAEALLRSKGEQARWAGPPAQATEAESRTDIYQRVTDRIVAAIEAMAEGKGRDALAPQEPRRDGCRGCR